MIWSLLKVLIFILLVAAATFGAGLLMETDGVMRLSLGGTEFTLTLLAGTVLVVLVMVGVWLIFKLAGLTLATLRFVSGDETAISRFFNRNRERRGIQALADGMLALASGEARLAQTKADRAARFLSRPELTCVLNAQAAEMAGDTDRATALYRDMLKDDRTRFVGVRGLMQQRLKAGDKTTALALAEKAFGLNSRHREVQDTLFRLQVEANDWPGAQNTLAAMLKTGTLTRDVHRRRDAVLTYAKARDALAAGDLESAERDALEANRLAPTLVPAAALAGRVLTQSGKDVQARKVLRKAWDAKPHPALAEAFANLAPDETPQARLDRFKPWIDAHPDADEAKLLAVELHLAAGEFGKARKLLTSLLGAEAPQSRALALMAAVEQGSGASEHEVRAWLARAVEAPRGPQWVCGSCHSAHSAWAPACDSCGAFDALTWTEPAEGPMDTSVRAALLPLLTGPDPVPVDDPAPEAELVDDTPPLPEDDIPAPVAAHEVEDAEIKTSAP